MRLSLHFMRSVKHYSIHWPINSLSFSRHLTMMSDLGSDFQSEILPTTIYVLIGFWIIQIIDNNLSQPIIFKSVSSHPLKYSL
jgi:hypothetical protein